MNNNSKEELKGNEFNRLLLVPCEEKLLIGECAASAEYKVNVACKNNSALQSRRHHTPLLRL